jgi:hypothetical protein
MLNQAQINSQRAALLAKGYQPATGTTARQKFTMNGPSLVAGEYTPETEGEQLASHLPARNKNGRAYDAIAFKNKEGKTVFVGLGGIFNPIRIVKDMDASKLVSGANWQGEKAQPTFAAFRYGSLSDMPSQNIPDDNSATGYSAVYTPSKFTLAKEVVYVEPRFIEGQTAPIFDEKCRLRRAVVVADIEKHLDANH